MKSIYQKIRFNRYMKVNPTCKQAAYMCLPHREALYGGAAGGGKSTALLLCALQYVDFSDYNAIILRKSYSDLSLPGALMDIAYRWLYPTDAKWNASARTWTFPSGAKLSFGYLADKQDKYRYQSSEFQFIAFDELTQFHEEDYLYLFSRLRKKNDSKIPLRMRTASNPGGIGHGWVKARFIQDRHPDRVYLPARIVDNPYLDESYRQSLEQLSYVVRQQYLYGDWDIAAEGNLFRREWWTLLESPPIVKRQIRAWDLASTAVSLESSDPDYSVGVLLAEAFDGSLIILDVVRFRANPAATIQRVQSIAAKDGVSIPILIEQEVGSAGKLLIEHLRQNVLRNYQVHGIRPTGSKVVRAQAVSAACESGQLACLLRSWTDEFLHELSLFPNGAHDDCVDALSHAYHYLDRTGIIQLQVLSG